MQREHVASPFLNKSVAPRGLHTWPAHVAERAMKIFPIVCLLSVVAFYIIASRLVIRPSTPPIGAIVHHEPNLQRIPAAPTANKINAAAAAVEVAPPTTIAAPTPAAAASAAPKTVLDGTLDAALRAAVPSGKPQFALSHMRYGDGSRRKTTSQSVCSTVYPAFTIFITSPVRMLAKRFHEPLECWFEPSSL